MVGQLNGTTVEYAKRQLELKPKALETRLSNYTRASPDQYDVLSSNAYWLADLNKSVGLYRYLTDYPLAPIAESFRASATWSARTFENRIKGNLRGDGVWTLHLCELGVVTAFGSPEERRILSSVPPLAAVQKPDAEAPSGEASIFWQRQLARQPLEETSVRKLLATCEAENAGRRERQWVHGIARSLLAIAQKSLDELDAGLEEVLAFHKYEATRGGWNKLPEGILSMVALGLMRFGLEAGLETRVRSDYAPLELLQVK